MKLCGNALDQVRKYVAAEHGELARALSIREFLADLWTYREEADAKAHFAAVISWCSLFRMEPS